MNPFTENHFLIRGLSVFREILLGTLKPHWLQTQHTLKYSQAGVKTGSNITSNCLLVWKNSSQSIWSFQWQLIYFLHFLQKSLESLQDQAPLAIPFSSGLCSSQRSRKPALKRFWKVQLLWHISWYEDMFSYLISYYCENWKYNTHFFPSLGRYDFIGLTPLKVKCFIWR